MVACPGCSKRLPNHIHYCPYCGAAMAMPRRRGWWVWAMVIPTVTLLSGGVVWLAMRPIATPAPTPISMLPQTPIVANTAASPATPIPTLEQTTAPGKGLPTLAAAATVTPAPTRAVVPTLAPVPTKVSAWTQGRLAYLQKQSELHDLYILDLGAGGNTQPVLHPGESEFYLGPAWSPDGSQLALYTFAGRVLVTRPDSNTGPQSLADCSAPTWSPNGQQLVCHRRGESFFTVMDVNTGTLVRKVIHGMASAVLPAWSPTGAEIAFAMFQGERTGIWRVSVSGEAPVPLATTAFQNYAPAWSPDGQWIAYQSDLESADSEIWIMDREGKQARRLTHTAAGWSRAPAWSPDGQWLAFVSNQAGSIGADYGEIFVVSVRNGEVYQVTRTGGQVYDWRVTWGRSPAEIRSR